MLLRVVDRRGWRKGLHKYSQKHEFALELRISLLVLFTLAALAVSTHVSIMLAGFALGLVIGAIGEPRRLARQLFAVAEGFFSPLFFVWLGASLQVRELGSHPKFILLGLGLGLGGVLAHGAGRLLGQPLTLTVLTSTQLGVAVAAAAIGTQEHLLLHRRIIGVDTQRIGDNRLHIDRGHVGGARRSAHRRSEDGHYDRKDGQLAPEQVLPGPRRGTKSF